MNDFWSMSGSFFIPPSRWTSSQTLLAERRISPYSTEVHWRFQNYRYEFGCQARETHRWLLEYRWVSRHVWSLDRFHTIYSTRWKSSWRIYLVRGEIDEKAAYIQARSSMARVMEVNGERTPSWRRSKSGLKKRFILTMPENCVESISLTPRIRSTRKPSRTRVRNWKHQWLLLCPMGLWRMVGAVHPPKLKQNLRVFWKLMNPPECVWEIRYRIIMKTILQEKVRIHYSTTIWFTSLFLCLKLWKFLQQKQRWMGKIGKNLGVEPDQSQK